MHGGEAALFNKRQRLGELLLRLAGEAGNKIGGDGHVVEVLPQQRHRFIEAGGIVFPVHALQRFVTAGLQRQGSRLPSRMRILPAASLTVSSRSMKLLPSFRSWPQLEISMPVSTSSR